MDHKLTDAGGATMNLVNISGYPVCTFDRTPEEATRIVENIKRIECREDDIFILAPVKSGTHWIWEICSMLLSGKAETVPKSKSSQMLEHVLPETICTIPSPRVLNSHLSFRFLPTELFQKKCKIIHIVRNPKDVAVSWYNHVTGIKCYGYNGTWENFLPLFLEDKLEYGSWSQCILDWEKFRDDNPDYPLYVTSYELMHRNYIPEIRNIAKFLNAEPEENLIEAIAEKCRLKNMRVDKEYPKQLKEAVYNNNYTMYRKGEIGDWKNWFTVAQNELFDHVMSTKMSRIKHKFEYS